MNAQFQSLFENVCRCFGHTPTSRAGGTNLSPEIDTGENDANEQRRESIATANSEASSVSGKRRTSKLTLNDKQYDELFDKVKRGSSQTSKYVQNGQPPCHEGKNKASSNVNRLEPITDHDTAEALAKAKIAANPPRYRSKRKRPSQTREEIFRNKIGSSRIGSTSCLNGKSGAPAGQSRNSNTSSTPKTDFARLLNPSLALCFATPVRGTEEEQEEQDLKSLDHSDTATLNTNGDDTITSTLYFDSKYAHIQESTPPMPLFSQFKIGQAKDEIRTIMATDSHSSVRMIKIMEQNQNKEKQQKEPRQASGKDYEYQKRTSTKRTSTTTTAGAEAESSSNTEMDQLHKKASKSRGHRVSNKSQAASAKVSSRRIKETIKISSDGLDRDEDMEDAVPDVKPLSSSTDSSRMSNKATRHASIQ
mmetsp:Transcript_6793/g.16678  ORF Transcript_6793/g.16678 Transcript_6793/m.16678 type:complete len:420 (+) Transcript_6793:328-1587(+)|eukprot:CAMPEP_0197176882 /NCGR_PEP_ID=MMETSP1423-20130617/2664_1 /TAXON_ID=476441 /ORGANISM="Pseudo-nitzschia heimii, Strain UNC1101" /LENGTH=419 /DNA_ID=CAMNT_0042626325 /DNA_START=277 /DNA_END=1536 /DNA_ORIENTATION=-